MLNQQQLEPLNQPIKASKIIFGALPMGVVVATVILYIVKGPPKFNQNLDFMTLIGLAMVIPCFAAALFVPAMTLKTSLGSIGDLDKDKLSAPDASLLLKLFGLFQNSKIVQFALLEGAMFANLMLWFLGGSVYNLIVIPVGLLFMAIAFPTESSILAKLESMLDSLKRG